MLAHLEHMKNKGGEDILALGSDFDGIGGKLEVPSVDKLHLLTDRLKKEGWSERLIEKFAYKNTLRVIKENL